MVFALTAIHNWICQHSVEEDMYEQQEHLGKDRRKEKLEQLELVIVMSKEISSQIDQIREDMVQKMWDDYLKHTIRTPRVG